jgi:TrmH family RNA methyltransferase
MLRLSINQLKNLKKQKRENRFLLFLDNLKIIKDAISGGLKPQLILVEKEEMNEWGDICPVYLADRKTIEQLSDSKTPQGVVCMTEYLPHVVEEPKTNFLVVDSLQDPGNVGTLIRTATACGFEFVYLVDSVSPTNDKLIRSTVGTIFQSKIISITRAEFVNKAKTWKLNLIKADMNGSDVFKTDFENMGKNANLGLVVGNEGQGVSKEISALCKTTVRIPMKEGVESLNASISGAIIMYQIAKKDF